MEGHGGLNSATKPRQIGATRGYSRGYSILALASPVTNGTGLYGGTGTCRTGAGLWHKHGAGAHTTRGEIACITGNPPL
jgi:hypothetical protein